MTIKKQKSAVKIRIVTTKNGTYMNKAAKQSQKKSVNELRNAREILKPRSKDEIIRDLELRSLQLLFA